jgi:hypothetical protein
MKWNHLPVSGGVYEQDPLLMDKFMYIFSERSLHEEREAKKKERGGKSSGTLGRSARSM